MRTVLDGPQNLRQVLQLTRVLAPEEPDGDRPAADAVAGVFLHRPVSEAQSRVGFQAASPKIRGGGIEEGVFPAIAGGGGGAVEHRSNDEVSREKVRSYRRARSGRPRGGSYALHCIGGNSNSVSLL